MSNDKVSIIEAVTNPLGFFVLVVLLVEIIFGIAATMFKEQTQIIIIAMIILIFLLVGIVAFLFYFRPEALRGMRYEEDPEISQIRKKFRGVEKLADKLIGEWSFVTQFNQQDGQPQQTEIKGFCQICKRSFDISMSGSCIDSLGKYSIPFEVKKVFTHETGLTYIFEVPKGIGHKILGVAQVGFVINEGEPLIRNMTGDWAVLGTDNYGKVEFSR